MNALQFGEGIYLTEAELSECEIDKDSGLSPKYPDSVFHIEREEEEYAVIRLANLPPIDKVFWSEKKVETLKLDKYGVSSRADIAEEKFSCEFIGIIDGVSTFIIKWLTSSPPSSL